jgi:uncharacterized protein
VGTTEWTPVAEDLFRRGDDGPALVGSHCAGCGTHYFPRSMSCRNPACDDKAVSDVLLGRRGHLYSWTVQAYRPPALFSRESSAPYAIGLVELPDGLRVLGMLTGVEPGALRIGMAVELTVEALGTDGSGREVLTYAWTPGGGTSAP